MKIKNYAESKLSAYTPARRLDYRFIILLRPVDSLGPYFPVAYYVDSHLAVALKRQQSSDKGRVELNETQTKRRFCITQCRIRCILMAYVRRFNKRHAVRASAALVACWFPLEIENRWDKREIRFSERFIKKYNFYKERSALRVCGKKIGYIG